MKTKKLRKNQRGFTIIELLLVIALTGIITTAITMTFFQVFDMNTRTANRMAAVSQVLHAGKLVSEDILEAQSVDAPESSGFPLTLTRTEPESSANHTVIYTLEDMPSGEFKILWREHYIDSALNSTTKVAEYINLAGTSCECNCDGCDCGDDGLVLTFTVTATVGEQSEVRVYEVKPRPGS